MEGDDFADPEFLDSSGIIPGAIRLDDREQLVRESIRESFSWWRPRPCLPRSDPPCINDLATHRWYSRSPIPDLEVVRRVQAREGMAYDELLARYHRTVLKVADGHMPRYWRARRSSLRDKHANAVFYEDLVAAGVAAMWKAALKFDLEAGYRFWTAAQLPVLGAISDEARLWRRGGSGESRLDRWLYTHPQASAEQVLQAQERLYKRTVLHSLQEAAEGIKQFWSWRSDAEVDFDEPTGSFRSMYSCFNRYTLSPQLEIHERLSLVVDRLSGGLDTGGDVGDVSRPKSPRDLLDCTETAFIQFKSGKRQVTRQKAASYCYGIVVTPELRARALKDLEFAVRRWQSRTRRGPLPGEQYPRWSTKFGLGKSEHENKQIVPAYLTDGNPFKWVVRYRGAEGDIPSVLESPSWHCRNPKQPCEFCEEARTRSRSHNVPLRWHGREHRRLLYGHRHQGKLLGIR